MTRCVVLLAYVRAHFVRIPCTAFADYDPGVSVRTEIEQQQILDRNWGSYQVILDARVGAVLGAQRALAQRELGADWALRQSLVDLAAISELVAEELPAPRV